MKPIIKWPGGKSREFKHIKKLIPRYNRYVEPFFGGGGIFFKLNPEKAVVNDISENLMRFYTLIKDDDKELRKYLEAFCLNWKSLNKYFELMYNELYDLFINYRNNNINDDKVAEEIEVLLEDNHVKLKKILDENLILDYEDLRKEFKRNIVNKIKRTKKNEIKKEVELPDDDIKDNIETGFRSGFYMHFRNIYNDIELKRNDLEKLSNGYKAANFYFIREFCYGSMFRYNKKGEFNIPYGGISYNKKDFKKKIDRILSKKTREYFNNTKILCSDFEKMINSINLEEDDFVFFDPPYDTTFSAYEDREFDKQDQKRLAELIYNMEANFILIIKNTDFIFDLYNDEKDINILAFDKKYCYNVRDRNDRDVKHLIITNINSNTVRELDYQKKLSF